MPVDFFEKELAAVRERYNQTFGNQVVCNIETRYRVIIAIVHMGVLAKKIEKTKDKAQAREDIRLFIKIKNTLMTIFSTAEKIYQQRRRYDNGNRANRRLGRRSNVG
jgi:hypothetical protein